MEYIVGAVNTLNIKGRPPPNGRLFKAFVESDVEGKYTARLENYGQLVEGVAVAPHTAGLAPAGLRTAAGLRQQHVGDEHNPRSHTQL